MKSKFPAQKGDLARSDAQSAVSRNQVLLLNGFGDLCTKLGWNSIPNKNPVFLREN